MDVAGDTRPLLSPAAKEALLVLFSREGNYAQELLVEQAVATADAASRQLAAAVLGRLLGSAPALAGLSALEALGPWRALLAPLPTPLELLNRWAGWAGRAGEGAGPIDCYLGELQREGGLGPARELHKPACGSLNLTHRLACLFCIGRSRAV